MLNLRNKFYQYLLAFIVISVPITNVFVSNLSGRAIKIGDTLSSFIFLGLVFIILFFILKIYSRLRNNVVDHYKLLLITSGLFYCIFLYSIVDKVVTKILDIIFTNINNDSVLITLISILLWIVLFVVLYLLINLFYSKNLYNLLFGIFILIFLSNIFLIINYYRQNTYFLKPPDNIFEGSGLGDIKFTVKPNVYFIVSDMYASEEYMNITYPDIDYDINDFLQTKKFFTTTGSLSNYGDTSLSITSVLNADYFKEDIVKSNDMELIFHYNIENKSAVDAIFKENKYDTNYIFCWGDYDLKKKYCINKRDISYFADKDITFFSAILYHTPLKIFMKQFSSFKKDISRTYVDNFKDIVVNNNDVNTPFFTYLHLEIPHPPYIFDENCNFKQIPSNELTTNNKLITNDKNRYEGYKNNFLCTTNVLKDTINEILNNDKEAYIILISDHGPHLYKQKDNQDIEYIDVMEVHSAIAAYKLSDSCNSSIKLNDIAHVNIFRILFNCLGDKELPLLNNYIFYNDVKYHYIPSLKIDMEELDKIKRKK